MRLIMASRISRSVIACAISEQMAQLSLITDVLVIEVLPGHNKKEAFSPLSLTAIKCAAYHRQSLCQSLQYVQDRALEMEVFRGVLLSGLNLSKFCKRYKSTCF